MPIVFVHGVNTRETQSWERDVAARDAFFDKYVIKPLAVSDPDRFGSMRPPKNPLWGKLAATFSHNMACLPDIDPFSNMGPAGGVTESDAELNALVEALAGVEPPPDHTALRLAALNDPVRLMEAILAPVRRGDIDLIDNSTDEELGQQDMLLISVANEVASDPAFIEEIKGATKDEQVVETIKRRVDKALAAIEEAPAEAGIVTMGPPDILGIREKLGEVFDGAVDAGVRFASLIVLDRVRRPVHMRLANFLGDVFVYLAKRYGDEEPPVPDPTRVGKIPRVVIDAIEGAVNEAPASEPLIIVSHSMGGNVMYDILTHFRPNLEVDFWATVGTQVGMFEELKLFAISKNNIKTPKLPPNVKRWVNFYDPADVLAFKVEPIFDGVTVDRVKDIMFSTQVGAQAAHGGYFGLPRFYEQLRQQIALSL